MSVSQTEFDALEALVLELQNNQQQVLDNEGSYVTARELEFGIDLLSRTVEAAAKDVEKTVPRVNKIQQALNSLSIRFRAFASNEQAIQESVNVIPSSGEKDAMSNASGEPSANNPFILDDDIRLVNDRFPLAHASAHHAGGSDPLSHDNLEDVGVNTHAQIDSIIASLQALTSTHTTDIATNAADIVTASNEVVAIKNWDLDDIPDSLTYAKTTIAEKSRIVTQSVLDALNAAATPSGTNSYLTKDEADAIYQVIGSYVTMAYLSAIDTDLVPDASGVRDLGSVTHPWKELFLTGNTIYLGGITLSTIDGELAVNGQKVVRFDTVSDEIAMHPNVVDGKAHADTAHDWDYIRSNTGDTLPDATTLNDFITDHSNSGDHDVRYLLRNVDLDPSNVALITQLENGSFYQIPWSSLTNVPTLANAQFKGTISNYNLLPLSGTTNGDVYFIYNSVTDPNLAAAFVVVNDGATNRSDMYKPVYDTAEIEHNELGGRLANDAHPQYMTETDVGDYLNEPGVINNIKTNLGISGTGSLLSSTQENRLNSSYNHASEVGNPHYTTAEQTGAIRDANEKVKAYHLDLGTGVNEINSDDLVASGFEGSEYKFTTSTDRSRLSTAWNHSTNNAIHLDAAEKTDLLSGTNSTAHYHESDRDLANAIGDLDARTKLSFLAEAIADLPQIQSLELYKHDEHHDLADHSDTNTTGAQLDQLVTQHQTFMSAHNRDFTASGGDNGSSTFVARGNHKHDGRYVLLTDYATLGAPGSTQTVDWANLVNVPETVGDTRVLADATALSNATPTGIGEQVLVSDYNGSGNWGVYIAVGTNQGDWSLISAEDQGLLYASVNHNHDTEYVPLSGPGLADAINPVINTYFSTPTADRNIPTDVEQAAWETLRVTDFPAHVADDARHVDATKLSQITDAYNHISDPHLSGAEITELTTNFDANVYSASSEIGGNTRTLTDHIIAALAAVNDLTDIPGWPSAYTAQDFEDLFTHDHDAQYSALGHTHVLTDITDADTAIAGLGYWKETDVTTWFGTQTTDNLPEGSLNKYLDLSNLRDISAFTNLEDHADDAIPDMKHLTDGQRNALTSGLASRTDLHSHEGYHYVQDSDITLGLTRTSLVDPTMQGTAGMIGTKALKITGGAPANNGVSGEEGEIRVGNGKLFIYMSGAWYESTLSLMS